MLFADPVELIEAMSEATSDCTKTICIRRCTDVPMFNCVLVPASSPNAKRNQGYETESQSENKTPSDMSRTEKTMQVTLCSHLFVYHNARTLAAEYCGLSLQSCGEVYGSL